MVKNIPTIERSTRIRFGKHTLEEQAENTIVFNASNVAMEATNPGAVYLKPIRFREDFSDPNITLLMYDLATGEITESGTAASELTEPPLELVSQYGANPGQTSQTLRLNNASTAFTTVSNVGIANASPIHTLDVGSNLFVEDTGSNVLTVLGNTYLQDDVVIGGNLDVRGTLTTIDTENTTIKDAIVEIGKGNTLSDVGFIMNRPGSNVTIGYRDSVDEFVIAHTDSSANSNTIVPSGELIDVRVHGHLHTNSSLSVDTNLLHVDAISDRVGINTLFPQSTLDVIGDAKIASNLTVGTDGLYVDTVNSRVGINTLTPSTDFHIEGETYVSGNVTVDTDTLHVDTVNDRVGINTLSPTTDFHVEGDTYVSGNVDVHSELNVTGNAFVSSNAVVTGNVAVQSELNVLGNTYLTSNAVITGNADVQTDLNVVGNVDVQTNLNVATDAIVTGNVDVQTDLNITGNVYASSNIVTTGNVDVQQNLNVATDAIVTGNVDVQTDLNVMGNAYVSSNAVVTGNVDVQSDLNVTGDAYVTTYYGDGGLLSNVNLQVVSDHGNATSTTVRLTNATTGLVTTSNVEVGDQISIGNLTTNKFPIVGTGNFLENSTIGRSNGTIVISSDLEVLGNIVVDGNSYAIESNNLVINDRIIGIANNNVSHELDIGIIMQHPGKNIALIHHGEAQGDSDPHDHTFTIGYTQNTVVDNHVFDDSNLITVEILGNLITQNNLTVSENITVVGATLLQDSVGIANTAPIHDLDVGSNLYVDDQGSNVLHVTGTAHVSDELGVLRLIDAGQYSRTRIGSGSGDGTQNTQLNQIAIGENSGYNSQRTDAIAIGQEAGYTGQGTDTIAIGHNAGHTDQRPNAVAIGLDAGKTTQGQGSIAIGDSAGEITQDDYSVAIGYGAGKNNQGRMTVAIGTWAGQTNQSENSIVINASGQSLNGSTSNAFYVDPIRENSGTSLLTYNPTTKEITQNNTLSNTLTVTNGLVTNLGGLTKKTYGYSGGTIAVSTTPEINVVFDSQLFSAKITAHLVEPTSNISVLNLDVTGGTGRDIGKGFLSIVGDQNSKHWNSTINTTSTTVTLTPPVGLLSDGTYGVHVEYTSPLGTGGVTSIDKNNVNQTTFDY